MRDDTYLAACAVLDGRGGSVRMRRIADALAREFDVDVIAVLPARRNGLTVVARHINDMMALTGRDQRQATPAVRAVIERESGRLPRIDLDEVVVTSFVPDHLTKVISAVGVDGITREIDSPVLDRILYWMYYVFLVADDEALAALDGSDELERWREIAWRAVAAEDPYGLIRREDVRCTIITTRTFNEHYQGSSYYYFL